MISFIAGLIAGCGYTLLFLSWMGWIRKPYPYRFVCHHDNCIFQTSSNDLESLDRVASSHEHYHKERP